MYYNYLKLVLPAFCLLLCAECFCQSGFTSAGGTASGSGGVLTYSTGLVSYTSHEAVGLTLSQGVQHAFEIIPLSFPESEENNFAIKAFPNPTADSFFLVSNLPDKSSLRYLLYSDSGKLIYSENIHSDHQEISLKNLSSASYILIITKDQTSIQSFQIIKTN